VTDPQLPAASSTDSDAAQADRVSRALALVAGVLLVLEIGPRVIEALAGLPPVAP